MMARTGKSAMLATVPFVTILFATACGGSEDGQQPETTRPAETTTTTAKPTAAPPPPAQAGPATITIYDYAYNEYNDVTVRRGALVTVKNTDEDPHTVTSYTPGAFNVDVPAKAEATFTAPSQPGSYPYHCGHHSSMHGTLIVQ